MYLVEVRRLRERQRTGEIPIREYAAHAEALKQSFALLGCPWTSGRSELQRLTTLKPRITRSPSK